MKPLFALVAIVMLLLTVPALAQGPDHRPDAWEQTATAAAGGGETQEAAQPPRATVTATRQPYPGPTEAVPYPYPEPEETVSFFDWLRGLLWKVE
jgi:hypothetical protein